MKLFRSSEITVHRSCEFITQRITHLSKMSQASLVVQMVKNLPEMWEIQVPPLCLEDPLEKALATHSSILAWRIPWIEEPGRLQSMESQKVGHN